MLRTKAYESLEYGGITRRHREVFNQGGNTMLHNLTLRKNIRSFSVSPENPTGARGNGAKAEIGKGTASNALPENSARVGKLIRTSSSRHETAVLADISGQGAVKHFWITDSAPAGRLLILRIYFDGQEHPAVEVPLSDFFVSADYNEYRQVSSLAHLRESA